MLPNIKIKPFDQGKKDMTNNGSKNILNNQNHKAGIRLNY